MTKLACCMLATAGVVAMSMAAPAVFASACDGIPDLVFCDDFDTYCFDNTGDPPCADGVGDNPVQDPFFAVWPIDLGCNYVRIDDGRYFSAPFSAKQGADGMSIRHKHVLAADVAALPGAPEGANAIQGTDANPLILHFKLDLLTAGKYAYQNRYVELVCGDDHAPTEPIVVGPEDCFEKTRLYIPYAGDGQPHASLAFGALAALDEDQNPCPAGSSQRATNYRLVMYDGTQWMSLGPNVPLGDVNDLHLCDNMTYITVTIRSTTLDIEISTLWNGSTCGGPRNIRSKTSIPRVYQGPFSAVVQGGPPVAAGGCLTQGIDPTLNDYANHLDDLILRAGEPVVSNNCGPSGACCVSTGFGTGTCSLVQAVDCDGTYLGDGTSCDQCSGCPTPYGDTDGDSDMDHDDFAHFQRCYDAGLGGSVQPGCECWNKASSEPQVIDGDDFAVFFNCATGPGVPFDAMTAPAECFPD